MEFRSQTLAAREANRQLATSTRDEKDRTLYAMADVVMAVEKKLLAANAVDVDAARRSGAPGAVIDRLRLDGDRVRGMIDGLCDVAALPGPVGDLVRDWRLGSGIEVQQVRVPFGVVGITHKNRPNVTTDAAGLCLKSGNAALLRGSSSTTESSRVYAEALREGLRNAEVSADAVALVEGGRGITGEMMTARGLVDMLIPRGRARSISAVVERAKVPVIETGTGDCHLCVDASADTDKAVAMLLNAKIRRPSVYNAVGTLLVYRDIAGAFLPVALDTLRDADVTVRGTPGMVAFTGNMVPAGEGEFDTEYLSLNLAVRIVADIDEVVTHIRRYTTGHSKTATAESRTAADRFVAKIDAMAVLVNASSRFVDGGRFGFGAEIGISAQKLRARDPMDLAELTSTKYIVSSDGQVRV